MSVLDRFRLTGKRMLITGGTRGLGREMAVAIADAGADVVLVARDQQHLEEAAEDIRALGRQAFTIAADVGQPDECQAACDEALNKYGPIDILINNVGGRRVNIPTAQLPLAKWQEMVDLNLTSTFLCTKTIGGAMVARGRGGRVINVASISGLIVNRGIGGGGVGMAQGRGVYFTKGTAGARAP